MRIGSLVRMTEEYKNALRAGGYSEHVDEFGDCVGVIEKLVEVGYPTQLVDVRWRPSQLRYGYWTDGLMEAQPMDYNLAVAEVNFNQLGTQGKTVYAVIPRKSDIGGIMTEGGRLLVFENRNEAERERSKLDLAQGGHAFAVVALVVNGYFD